MFAPFSQVLSTNADSSGFTCLDFVMSIFDTSASNTLQVNGIFFVVLKDFHEHGVFSETVSCLLWEIIMNSFHWKYFLVPRKTVGTNVCGLFRVTIKFYLPPLYKGSSRNLRDI